MSYLNFLTKIKNAQTAEQSVVKTRFSKMDLAIAELLVNKGYLQSFESKGKPNKKFIEINLKKVKTIKGIKFVSLPGRRIYTGYKEIKPVKNGYGMAVFSTPRGIMSDQEARRLKIGGQALFKIW